MRILAPFTRVSEVEPLIENGADELYCGLMQQPFSKAGSLNSYGSSKANLASFSELERAVGLADAHRVPVSMALNSSGFSRSQILDAVAQADKAAKAGVKGLIIADPGVIKAVSDAGIPIAIHVSTVGGVFNSKSVEFFKGLGASRVVLPKELSFDEIRAIAGSSSGMEIEVFVLNGLCHNVEGFCTLKHGMLASSGAGGPSLFYESLVRAFASLPDSVSSLIMAHTFLKNSAGCIIPYEVKRIDGASPDALAAASARRRLDYFLDTCAACSIPRLLSAGVAIIKIDGRCLSTAKKLSDVAFLRACLDFAASDRTEGEYKEFAMAQYRKFHGAPCGLSDCYPCAKRPQA